MSRRSFLKTGTAVAAGIAVAPNIIIAGEKTPKKEKKKKVATNDKLNILGVGIGGRDGYVILGPLRRGLEVRRSRFQQIPAGQEVQ